MRLLEENEKVPWILLFLLSWLLFALLADRRRLGVVWWTGPTAVVLQLLVDTCAIESGYYRIEDPVVSLYGSSLFFTCGPVLSMGALFGMYLPRGPLARTINVLVWAGIFCAMEYLLLGCGALVYLNWSKAASTAIDLMVFTVLTWIGGLRDDGEFCQPTGTDNRVAFRRQNSPSEERTRVPA